MHLPVIWFIWFTLSLVLCFYVISTLHCHHVLFSLFFAVLLLLDYKFWLLSWSWVFAFAVFLLCIRIPPKVGPVLFIFPLIRRVNSANKALYWFIGFLFAFVYFGWHHLSCPLPIWLRNFDIPHLMHFRKWRHLCMNVCLPGKSGQNQLPLSTVSVPLSLIDSVISSFYLFITHSRSCSLPFRSFGWFRSFDTRLPFLLLVICHRLEVVEYVDTMWYLHGFCFASFVFFLFFYFFSFPLAPCGWILIRGWVNSCP